MQGIASGWLLVAAFGVVAGLALLVAVRLYLISRAGQSPGSPGERPDA